MQITGTVFLWFVQLLLQTTFGTYARVGAMQGFHFFLAEQTREFVEFEAK